MASQDSNVVDEWSAKPAISWRKLHALGTSKVAQSSIIWVLSIPVLARLAEWLEQTTKVSFHIPANFVFMYFGAFFFAIGSVVFQLFCPTVIKVAPTFGQFLTGSHSDLELKNWFHQVSLLYRQSVNPRMIQQFLAILKGRQNITSAQAAELLGDKAGPALLNEFWGTICPPTQRPYVYDLTANAADNARPVARFAATIAYTVGGTCLAFVPIANFFVMTHYVATKPLF